MPPLEEVLDAARRQVAFHEKEQDGLAFPTCKGVYCTATRRELLEWEAQLVAERSTTKTPAWKCELDEQIAEVRQLLGRGEPDYPTSREVALAAEIEKQSKPRPASPAMRALMEACEAVASQLSPSPSFDITIRRGIEPYSIKLAREALALAKAELGEEATDA